MGRLGNFVQLPATGAEVDGAPEVNSILLDQDGKVKLFTVGYNVDRDAGSEWGSWSAVWAFERLRHSDASWVALQCRAVAGKLRSRCTEQLCRQSDRIA